VSTAVSRLGAVPATITRQRRRRRRTKALNQAITGAAQQITALARATARLDDCFRIGLRVLSRDR
jgi:Flp pilus assembly protein TadB